MLHLELPTLLAILPLLATRQLRAVTHPLREVTHSIRQPPDQPTRPRQRRTRPKLGTLHLGAVTTPSLNQTGEPAWRRDMMMA